jgi:hypothetical protein
LSKTPAGGVEDLRIPSTRGFLFRSFVGQAFLPAIGRDLNVVHEALEDGAELIYEESAGVPENQLSNWLCPKEQLSVFSKGHAKKDWPNYMPKEIADALDGAGFSGEELEGEA